MVKVKTSTFTCYLLTWLVHANRPIFRTIAICPSAVVLVTGQFIVRCLGKPVLQTPGPLLNPFGLTMANWQLRWPSSRLPSAFPLLFAGRRRRKTGFVLLYSGVPCCTISGPNWFPRAVSLVLWPGPVRWSVWHSAQMQIYLSRPKLNQPVGYCYRAGKTGFSPADWHGRKSVEYTH